MSNNSVVAVTGGASGIGAACCRELARQGFRVAVLDRNLDAAQSVAREIGASAFECDISDEEGMAVVAAQVEAWAPVAALINCAGIVQGRAAPYDMPMRKWDDIVRIDQRGTYVCCLAFARVMIARRSGAIVNIASVAGMQSMPMHAYGPAKAAVIAMSASLAAEWGVHGLRVNALSPGFTRTGGMTVALEKGAMQEAAMTTGAALQRLVEPREVAQAAAFLISEAASAITGINLPVDCGWMAGQGWAPYGGLPIASPDQQTGENHE